MALKLKSNGVEALLKSLTRYRKWNSLGYSNEGWLMERLGIACVREVSQMFFVRGDASGRIKFLLAKVTDDLIFTDTHKHMGEFMKRITGRFEVCKVINDKSMKFNGCYIV